MLLLAALFLLLGMGIVTLGGSIYRLTVRQGDENNISRVALSYIANQVCAHDADASVAVVPFGGGDAIALGADYDGIDYTTYLYLYNGQLCELFAEDSLDIPPSAGIGLVELSSFTCAVEGGSIVVTVADAEGGESSIVLTPRCGTEVGA